MENKEDTKKKWYQKTWVIATGVLISSAVVLIVGLIVKTSFDNNDVEPIQNQDSF